MAELLLSNIDYIDVSDAVHDAKLYKRGMTIVIQEDGWEWSETERGSAYLILKLPLVPRTDPDLMAYLEEETAEDNTVVDHLGNPRKILKTRRVQKVNLALCTQAVKDGLENTTISIAQRKAALQAITVSVVT